MKLGIVLVVLAFVTTIVSALYYYLSDKNEITHKKDKSKNIYKKYGRSAYYLSIVFISLASVYLYYLIFSHQFQVKYIYQYSSRDLPFGFLLSTFWAGQEGSFLFWTLCLSWLGLIFVKTSAKYENFGMIFLNLVQTIFLILLIKASPFALLDAHSIPVDGAGLNPLLQNFWMVIHPPILFIGYAATTFPFVVALSAMVKNNYGDWIKQSIPWVLSVSITLGAGIIIGAFWSYETLGWGGYWGWDPVENSSLIPWLTTLALFHGLIIERRSGALIKTNFVLAILTFVLVLYATFLTRSGVLADFSVHSFEDLGINGLLIIFLLFALISGFGLFAKRFQNLKGAVIDFSSINRENILLAGLLLLFASSLLTILGTSSPIITSWFGEPSQVDISFYNKVNLPIAIGMALVIGLAPLLRWHEPNIGAAIKRFLPSIVLTLISLIIAIYFGVYDVIKILFLGLSIFTIWSNIYGLTERFKKGWMHIGAPLAHFGVGLMFVGIIISGSFDQTQRVLLDNGVTKSVFNKKLTYMGMTTPPDGKNVVEVKVESGSSEYIAKPRLYFNRMTQGNMREPDIKYGALVDFYIAPLELRAGITHTSGSSLILYKEETKTFAGMNIHFHAFNMSSDHQSGDMRVGADLEIEINNQVYKITPFFIMGNSQKSPEPEMIKIRDGKNIGVKLTSIDADNKSISLEFSGLSEQGGQATDTNEQLLVEVSEKPFMNILWLGTVILTIGTIVAIKRRLSESGTA